VLGEKATQLRAMRSMMVIAPMVTLIERLVACRSVGETES